MLHIVCCDVRDNSLAGLTSLLTSAKARFVVIEVTGGMHRGEGPFYNVRRPTTAVSDRAQSKLRLQPSNFFQSLSDNIATSQFTKFRGRKVKKWTFKSP